VNAIALRSRFVSSLGDWIDRLFNQHKVVRRSLVYWAIGLITFVTIVVFHDLEKITTPVASAFGLVIGLLATVLGLYQWSRNKDGEK